MSPGGAEQRPGRATHHEPGDIQARGSGGGRGPSRSGSPGAAAPAAVVLPPALRLVEPAAAARRPGHLGARAGTRAPRGGPADYGRAAAAPRWPRAEGLGDRPDDPRHERRAPGPSSRHPVEREGAGGRRLGRVPSLQHPHRARGRRGRALSHAGQDPAGHRPGDDEAHRPAAVHRLHHRSVTTSPAVNPRPAQTPERPVASLARNAFHLVLGQVGTMVLGILFSAALGRTLGVGDFGLYFLITSFSAFALVLVDWGQQYFGIREVARVPERGGELLGTGLVLRAVGTALVCLPIGLSAWALGYDRRTIGFAVAFVALNLPLFLAQNFAVVFRGQDRMGLDATVSVTNRAAGLVLALAALGLGLGLGGVVVAQGFAGCIALGIAIHLYRRVSHGPLRFTRATAVDILTGGTAIVTMSLATNVQPYIDAILLSKLVPREAVGWYGAAKTVMGTLLAPSLILGAAAFPRLSRAAGNAPQFLREMRQAGRPMVWLGGLAAVGTWHFAPVAIKLIYGSKGDFGPAAIILSVFGLGLFLVFIDVLLGTSATAIGRTTPFSIIKIATVVLATGLELFLV